jgi:hypothetical protein
VLENILDWEAGEIRIECWYARGSESGYWTNKNICGGKMLELEFWDIYFLERCSLTDMQCCTLIGGCMPYKNWGLGAIGIS